MAEIAAEDAAEDMAEELPGDLIAAVRDVAVNATEAQADLADAALPPEEASDEELADLMALDLQDDAVAADPEDPPVAAGLNDDLPVEAGDAASEADAIASLVAESDDDSFEATLAEALDEPDAVAARSEPLVLGAESVAASDDSDDWGSETPAAATADQDGTGIAAAEAPREPVTAAQSSGFLSRARARVIKVRKAVMAQPDEEEDLPETIGGSRATPATVFEDDLVAVLREDPDLDPAGEDRRAILETSAADDEDIASRLMEEATSKLEGAENRRRFSAISHLKAAVAATVADRKLKVNDAPADPAMAPEDETDAYRDDLSKAVRPRRPVGDASGTTRRPVIETRQPPLVLVSEQRVDRPEDTRTDASVIRPRRITSGNLALTDDDDILDPEADRPLTPEEARSFADFADRMGATSLPDLLEAAAAYTASVEGRPHFSRPQILKKVAYVADDGDYSREDGLRSFGMLLRQGKIQKVRRGQFALADSSRYIAEARRAAR
jgi:hypothetical protein